MDFEVLFVDFLGLFLCSFNTEPRHYSKKATLPANGHGRKFAFFIIRTVTTGVVGRFSELKRVSSPRSAMLVVSCLGRMTLSCLLMNQDGRILRWKLPRASSIPPGFFCGDARGTRLNIDEVK